MIAGLARRQWLAVLLIMQRNGKGTLRMGHVRLWAESLGVGSDSFIRLIGRTAFRSCHRVYAGIWSFLGAEGFAVWGGQSGIYTCTVLMQGVTPRLQTAGVSETKRNDKGQGCLANIPNRSLYYCHYLAVSTRSVVLTCLPMRHAGDSGRSRAAKGAGSFAHVPSGTAGPSCGSKWWLLDQMAEPWGGRVAAEPRGTGGQLPDRRFPAQTPCD